MFITYVVVISASAQNVLDSFGRGLVACPSVFCIVVGAETRARAGAGAAYEGGEPDGWSVLSSSHVELVSSSNRRLVFLVVRTGFVLRGNNIVKYYLMNNLSLFPI